MKKIVIFDLDGTLLNTLDDLYYSTNYALAECCFLQRTKDEIRNFVGNGVSKLIERALPAGQSNDKFETCLNIFKRHYAKNMYNHTAPYEGIIEVLTKIKNLGINIAVVSNKFDTAVKSLCEKYFGILVDFAAGENEAGGVRKKPAPDTVLKVLEKYNINPNDAIYVGDSDVDILTAKNAGIQCISVTWGFKNKNFLLKHDAKIIIDKPDEIFKYL